MSDNDPRDYRTLGDLLRDAREQRSLELEQVNEATKISVRVLRALEQDDLEAASGAVYARAFVRTLARFYDLDPEWLGAKLDQLAGETSRPVAPVHEDDGVIAGPVPDPEQPAEPVATGPKWEVESTRVRKVGSSSRGLKVSRNLVLGMIAVLVVAIVLVIWMGRGSERGDQGSQGAPGSVGEPAGSVDDPGPARAEGDPAGLVFADPADEATTVTEPDEVIVEDIPDSPIDRSPQPHIERPERNVPGRMVESHPDESVGEAGLPSVLRPAGESVAATMALRVVARSPVEVTLSADGSRSEVRFLQAGQEWVVRGRDHFSLAVSDPDAVRLEIDGRPREVPSGWNGDEWILYPPRGDR